MQFISSCLRPWTVLVLVSLGLMLSACGGGGGDTGSSSGNSGGGVSNNGLSINTSAINFSATQNGALPATQFFTITWTGANVAGVLIGFPAGTTVPSWLNISAPGNTNTSPVTLNVGVNTTNLTPGNYSTTIRIVSGDINGNLIGLIDVPLTYVVYSAITAAPSSVLMTATQGLAAPGATITFSTAGTLPSFTPSLNYTVGSGYLDISSGANSITISANTNALTLTPGTYTANLTVLFTITGSTQSTLNIPITYTVTSALTAPSQINLNIDGSTRTADLMRSYSVASNTGNVINFSASINVNWATVSTTGTTSSTNNLSIAVVESEVATLGVGIHNALLTINSSNPNVSNIVIPVSASIALPQVTAVTPYVSSVNTANTVMVVGRGFSGFNGQVAFNFTPALSVNALSDTRMLVGHGALSAGDYRLNITSIGGLASPSTGVLKVVENIAYAATAISSLGTKSKIVYDNERKIIYAADIQNGEIERYTYNLTTSSWVAGSSLAIPLLREIALTPDGSKLVAITDQTIYTVELSTFIASARATNPDTFTGRHFRHVEVASNGIALVTTGLAGSGYTQSHSFDTRTFALTNTQSFYFANMGGSTDGERIIIGSNGVSPAPASYFYDPSVNTLTVTGISTNLSNVSLDRHATRIIMNTSVYSSSYVPQGTLPVNAASVLSPNGDLAYVYDSLTGANGTVRVFDLTSPNGAGGFTELTVTENIPAASPGTGLVKMVISNNGDTLVFGAASNIIVMPVPQ